MNENQMSNHRRKLAGIFLFSSFPFSYLSLLYMNFSLNSLDEGYYQLEFSGQSVSDEVIIGDVANSGVLPLIVSALIIGLLISRLYFKYKGQQGRRRYWVLLFLACWWVSNFGSIVAIVPFLSRYNILPALQ